MLFRGAVALRSKAYDLGIFRSAKGELPVISVGNLAVGGTGKTPVSAWLVQELVARGYRPALVARGYGEDEILLHLRWNPDVPMIRSPRRIDGVREAARLGRDIVVLDDGFQHRSLRREVDLLLLSPAHPFPGHLLPAGPYREPHTALKRAQQLLITAKGEDELEGAEHLADALARIPGTPPVDLFPLEAGEWHSLDGSPSSPPHGLPWILASIAQPEGFERMVYRFAGGHSGLLTFPDHHAYTEGDIRGIAGRVNGGWIATTEKDAVKLIAFRELLPEVRVLPLVAAPPVDLAERLIVMLEDRTRRRGGGK